MIFQTYTDAVALHKIGNPMNVDKLKVAICHDVSKLINIQKVQVFSHKSSWIFLNSKQVFVLRGLGSIDL